MFWIYCFSLSVLPEKATWFGSPIISELFFGVVGATAWYNFRQYRRRQRAEAAVRVLVLWKSCVEYVNEIAGKPGLYRHEGYYPDHIPEMPNNHERAGCDQRPSRLIANRIFVLNKELNEPIVQVAGKEAKKLIGLRSELQKKAQLLTSSIAAQFDATDEIAAETRPNISECCLRMKDLTDSIEIILTPIIEGQGIYLKVKCLLLDSLSRRK